MCSRRRAPALPMVNRCTGCGSISFPITSISTTRSIFAKGIGCATCHGRIDQMPLTEKAASLRMQWCIHCHRDPRPNLRPHEAVFDMGWQRRADTPSGEELFWQYHIHSAAELTDCSVCHR
jgi:hypothetical protein